MYVSIRSLPKYLSFLFQSSDTAVTDHRPADDRVVCSIFSSMSGSRISRSRSLVFVMCQLSPRLQLSSRRTRPDLAAVSAEQRAFFHVTSVGLNARGTRPSVGTWVQLHRGLALIRDLRGCGVARASLLFCFVILVLQICGYPTTLMLFHDPCAPLRSGLCFLDISLFRWRQSQRARLRPVMSDSALSFSCHCTIAMTSGRCFSHFSRKFW